MTDEKVVTYRSDAEQPIVKPLSPWPNRWRHVRGPLGRVGVVLAVTSGVPAGAIIAYFEQTAIGIGVFLWHIFLAALLVSGKFIFGDDGPFAEWSWTRTIVIAAWAPITLPVLGIYRLGKWIVTGQ